MDPCHVRPFVLPGVVIETHPEPAEGPTHQASFEAELLCDYCGAPSLAWRKCKLICDNCRQINKSCADL